MPSDAVTLVVSTGIGVSVVAGIISGVCYILAHGFPNNERGRRRSALQWHCPVCGRYLRSIGGVLEGAAVVTCSKCGGRACRDRCCLRGPAASGGGGDDDDDWTCQPCVQQQKSWLKGVFNIIQPNYKVSIRQQTIRMGPAGAGDGEEGARRAEREQVREFIERLVASMIGGDVDDVRINKLYNDKSYLPISGQSPCTAHAALKQIVQKLLRDALDLPILKKLEDHPAVPSDESGRTYEDLLATAILNKVITNCQNNLPSSSAGSVSSRLSSSSRKDEKEYFFGEATLEDKYKNTDIETTSISSLEEWIQSDSSLGSTTKFVDRVSLTIQQSIEEAAPTSESEGDEADIEYFRKTNSLLVDDDSNWYLQKRQFQGAHSPVPVPMLVPHPTTDAKVLIGDKAVDDTSDLSDAASDYGDTESVPGIKTILLESKKVIGGKNRLDNIHLSDAESSGDSGVKEDRGDFEKEDSFYHSITAHVSLDDESLEDTSLFSIDSNVEKDVEYTEKYGTLPRTIVKTPPSSNINKNDIVIYNNNCNTENDEMVNTQPNTKNYEIFEGRYSKREKEKWKNPIEMKNNPYSKENIEKRIHSSNMFGTDYYRRQASVPSGARKTNEATLSSNEDSPNQGQDDVHNAVPTIVDANIKSQVQLENLFPFSEKQFHDSTTASEITSDSDLSFVNCYDVENLKIYQKSSDGDQKEVKIIGNTKGLLYNPLDPETEYSNEIQIEKQDEDKSEMPILPYVAPRTFKNNIQSQEIDKPIAQKRNKIIEENRATETNKENELNITPMIVQKKLDNTLIKKIYSDPVVRRFALVNRDQIPIAYEELIQTPKSTTAKLKLPEQLDITQIEIKEISVINNNAATFFTDKEEPTSFSLELSDEESFFTQPMIMVQDPEINDLKEKKLVANRLGEFSKSFPNLNNVSSTISESNIVDDNKLNKASIHLLENSSISVKDLKKIFEQNDELAKKSIPLHSLTGRSLYKPVRSKIEENKFESEQIIKDARLSHMNQEDIKYRKYTSFIK